MSLDESLLAPPLQSSAVVMAITSNSNSSSNYKNNNNKNNNYNNNCNNHREQRNDQTMHLSACVGQQQQQQQCSLLPDERHLSSAQRAGIYNNNADAQSKLGSWSANGLAGKPAQPITSQQAQQQQLIMMVATNNDDHLDDEILADNSDHNHQQQQQQQQLLLSISESELAAAMALATASARTTTTTTPTNLSNFIAIMNCNNSNNHNSSTASDRLANSKHQQVPPATFTKRQQHALFAVPPAASSAMSMLARNAANPSSLTTRDKCAQQQHHQQQQHQQQHQQPMGSGRSSQASSEHSSVSSIANRQALENGQPMKMNAIIKKPVTSTVANSPKFTTTTTAAASSPPHVASAHENNNNNNNNSNHKMLQRQQQPVQPRYTNIRPVSIVVQQQQQHQSSQMRQSRQLLASGEMSSNQNHHSNQGTNNKLNSSCDHVGSLGQDQCDLDNDDNSLRCMQLVKKILIGATLCAIIGICWVMIIHTLKWISIRGESLDYFPLYNNQQSSTQLYQNYLDKTRAQHDQQLQQQQQQQQQINLPVTPQQAPRLPAMPPESSLSRSASLDSANGSQDQDQLLASASNINDNLHIGAGGLTDNNHNNNNNNNNNSNNDEYDDGLTFNLASTKQLASDQAATANKKSTMVVIDADDDDDDRLSSRLSNGHHQQQQQHQHQQQQQQHQQSVYIGASFGKRRKRVAAASTTAPASSIGAPKQVNLVKLAGHLNDNNNIRDHADRWSAEKPSRSTAAPAAPAAATTTTATLDKLVEKRSSNMSTDEQQLQATGADDLQMAQINGARLVDEPVNLQATLNQLDNQQLLQQQQHQQPATLSSGGGSSSGERKHVKNQNIFYDAPFFTTWFLSIWNILFMPIFAIISTCCFRHEDGTTKKLLVESISQFMDNGLTTLQFLYRCSFFSILWILTVYGLVSSLATTDATVVMALFATSATFIYLFSWVVLHQQFVGVRIVAVIICTTGIALLAYMDNSDNTHRTLGSVLLVTGSALSSAIYRVFYQRMFGFWSIAQMSLFFTIVGFLNAILMWPMALLLYFTGTEVIIWRYIPWMHLAAAGGLHLLADVVAYFGPICTYDIFLTLGLLLAVILSAVIDIAFYKIHFFGMKLAGILLLILGFLVCLLPENWNEYVYDIVNAKIIKWKTQRSIKKSRNKVQDLTTGQMSRLRTLSGRVK